MKTITIIFFLSVVPLINFGQHRFTHLNIEDGLVENSITEIFQDSEGYMWFATQDGISQYDGYHFKNYTISNNKFLSLSNNFLWGFAEDSLGYIWCCSRDGLNRIDKKSRACTYFYRDSLTETGIHNQINDVTIFNGVVFVNISGEIYISPIRKHYDKQKNLLENKLQVKDDSIFVYAFHIDKEKNELYFVHKNGLYNYNNNQLILVPGFSEGMASYTTFLKTTQDKNNNIWFSNGNSVFYYNTVEQKSYPLNYDFKNAVIRDLLWVENEIWVATYKGLFIFNNNQLAYRLIKTENTVDGIFSNYISALGKDKTGKVWVGTSGNGIGIYESKKERFKYLAKETFRDQHIFRSIVQDEFNRLIVATTDRLFVVELNNARITRSKFAQDQVKKVNRLNIKGYENIIPTTVVKGINGDVLIGTKGNGLIVLDKKLRFKKVLPINTEEEVTNVVSNIIVSHNEDIWMATYNGVYLLNKEYQLKQHFAPLKNGLSSNYFLSVFEDREHHIWLGSDKGIYKYLQATNTFKNYDYKKNQPTKSPGFNFIAGFEDIGDDNLWIATYGGGLSKMNKEKETFEHFTIENGLVNNVCNGILVDKKDNLWLNTNKGISKFNTKKEKFTNFSKTDGLHFNEFNLNSFYKNSSEEFFLGTPIGLVIFNPNDINTSEYQPQIIMNKIDINYVDASDRIINNHIELFPSDKAITFHFAALNFSQSPKIKYKYRLEGYNDYWVTTDELIASYTSLPDGEFTFLVNATNEDGIWNNITRKIKVIVHPPLYKTWWSIIISAFVLLAILILVIRHFSQRKIKKRLRELRMQQEILQEKQRISRDLHDNIGSQITYLISSIDQEAYSAKQNQDTFERLSTKARSVMNQLRQTIWVINKEAINLVDLTQKIGDYSSRILSSSEINFIIEPNGEKEKVLPPKIVNHLFSIVQEANNNVVKHAKATKVNIEINIQNNMIELTIRDNGLGIGDIKNYDDHFGLKNMKDRAEELKGSLKIGCGENHKGTEIKVIVPL